MRLFASAVLCCLWHALLCASQCNQLVSVTECICPWQNVTYECSVMGGSFTVYDGSAFQCFDQEIALRNNAQFGNNNPTRVCNSPQINITGIGISQTSNCFTSQLHIALGEEVSGQTVSCSIDDSRTMVPIDSTTLTFSTEAFPPPNNISLINASATFLTFSWNRVELNCPSLNYMVLTDCGTCPDRTDQTNITCTGFSDALVQSGRVSCMLTVQTVICEGRASVAGNGSSLLVTLKVPDAPVVIITPYYDALRNLQLFHANISTTEAPIFVSDFVNGSTIKFTITFRDDNGEMCSSSTPIPISSSSCTGGNCSLYSIKRCSGRTNVAVYASNIFGDGSSSPLTAIDDRNNFVMIEFDVTARSKRVNCIFLNQAQNSLKTCEISAKNLKESNQTNFGNHVSINLVNIIGEGTGTVQISYNVTATTNSQRVVEQGVYTANFDASSDALIAGVTVGLTLVLVVLAMSIVVIAVLSHLLHQKSSLINVKEDGYEKSHLLNEEGTTVEDAMHNNEAQMKRLNLGQTFVRVEEGDELPQDGKILIVKQKDNNSDPEEVKAINNLKAAKIFFDNDLRLKKPEERDEEYRDFEIYVQSRAHNRKLPRNAKIMFSSEDAAPGMLRRLSSKLSIPRGFTRINHWFEVVEQTESEPVMLSELCARHGRNLVNEIEDGKIYVRDGQQNIEHMDLTSLKVIAAYQHQLLKKAQGTLGPLANHNVWKSSYFEASDDMSLDHGSKVLFYEPELERVPPYFDTYEVTSSGSGPVKLSTFIKEKTRKHYQLNHTYKQHDLRVCSGSQFENIKKFIAQYESGGLYKGSDISLLKGDSLEFRPGWKLLYTPFESDDEVAQGTIILYTL